MFRKVLPSVVFLTVLAVVSAHGQTISTVVGGGPTAGKSYSAVQVSSAPNYLAIDAGGNLYYADTVHNRIFKVTPDGSLTVAAGNGSQAYSGDGGVATAAALNLYESGNENEGGVAVDAAGDLFIADSGNNVVREVAASTGIITTIAGNGQPGYSGDGGAATGAALQDPIGIAVDANGDVYVSDRYNCVVREVVASTSIIKTIAGTGQCGASGDGGPATKAGLSNPGGLAFDAAGNLYVVDQGNVREIDTSTGIIRTVIQATTAYSAIGLAFDGSGNLFMADSDGAVWKVPVGGHTPIDVAGSHSVCPTGSNGDGGTATAACLHAVTDVVVDPAGDLYISELADIRKVDAATGVIQTFAGNGYQSWSGMGGPAAQAELFEPTSVALDSAGDLVIADSENQAVEKVSGATGVIQTVVGGLAYGSSPLQAATDNAGNIFIANGTIINGNLSPLLSEVPAATGIIQPLANIPGSSVFVDGAGDLYVSGLLGNDVSEVVAGTGQIKTIAGGAQSGYSGDGGLAASATLNNPEGVFVDASGDVFIADSYNNAIREVEAATGNIRTVAGGTASACSNATDSVGDGCLASQALLNAPSSVYVDTAGNLFIADRQNNRVREVKAGSGIIQTLAGDGTCGYSGDGGAASQAQLCLPESLAGDASGDIVVADYNNDAIREIKTEAAATLSPASFAFGDQNVASTSAPQTITVTNTGGVGLTVAQVALAGATPGDFAETDNCSGATVAVNGTCAVQVTFTPTATGSRAATLTINDNAPGSPQSVGLSGTAVAPSANVSPATVAFSGEIVNSTTAAQAVTVSNTGNAALTISGIAVSGDFAETNKCGSSLAASATCAIEVTFTPSATGTRSGTLTVTDNASSGNQTAALSGTGEDVVVTPASGSSASATVAPGGTAQYSLSFASAGGFAGNVAISCAVQPAVATIGCSANPTTLDLTGAVAQTVAVSVTTTAGSILPSWLTWRRLILAPALGLLAWLLLYLIATLVGEIQIRERARRWAMLTFLLGSLVLLPGCGGSSSPGGTGGGTPAAGTPAGTYTVAVTAAAANGSRTTQLTLTVK